MNKELFLTINNSLESVNRAHYINVNYDDTGKQQGNNSIGKITGITITTLRKQLDGDDFNLDITQVLQQLEKISFTLKYRSFPDQKIDLTVISRRKERGAADNEYFYFDVEETEFIDYLGTNTIFDGDIDNNTLEGNGEQVFFSPTLSEVNFSFSDFNPLLSNSITNRLSSKRQIASRNNLDINPVNSDSLLSETAPLAEIPDSNYSLTGLVNSRYEGSKTDAEKFGGIPPSFTGRTFTGEVFSNVVTKLKISSSLEQDRVYKELFHSGPEEFPTFTIVSSSLELLGSAGTSNLINISSFTGSDTNLVDVGNILFLTSSAGTEFVRLEQLDVKNNKIKVERSYLSDKGITSQAVSHAAGTVIEVVQPTKLFEFGSGTTKVELVENAKVLVKESRLILETDKYGNVFTSSSIA